MVLVEVFGEGPGAKKDECSNSEMENYDEVVAFGTPSHCKNTGHLQSCVHEVTTCLSAHDWRKRVFHVAASNCTASNSRANMFRLGIVTGRVKSRQIEDGGHRATSVGAVHDFVLADVHRPVHAPEILSLVWLVHQQVFASLTNQTLQDEGGKQAQQVSAGR